MPGPLNVRRDMADGTPSVPKTIWFLWFQGLEKAPYVVRKCHESWITKNPSWRVVSLDETTLPSLASVDYSTDNIRALTLQSKSDLVRLDLLARHGGVWADATCFCVRPLDDWLPPNLASGFFAFHRPRPDRIISSWFLAAEPENILVSRLLDRMVAYWGQHSFRNDQRRFAIKALTRLLKASPRTRDWWFSPFLRDRLALSPYWAIMYMFEALVRQDPDCARVWAATPKISADGPHRLYRAGLLSPVSPELRAEVDSRQVPVYKMTWNIDEEEIPQDSVLEYLLVS